MNPRTRPARKRPARPVAGSVDAEGFPTAAAIARRLQEVHDRVFGAPPPFILKGSSPRVKGRGLSPCDAKLATLPTPLPHPSNDPHP